MTNKKEQLNDLLDKFIDGGFKQLNHASIEYIHNSDISDHLIANGVTVQEWISVKDRLPEPRENPVLVTYDGGVWMAWKHSTHWELPSTLKTNLVTHWMPLPEPPKGE